MYIFKRRTKFICFIYLSIALTFLDKTVNLRAEQEQNSVPNYQSRKRRKSFIDFAQQLVEIQQNAGEVFGSIRVYK